MIDKRDQVIKDNMGYIKRSVMSFTDGSDPDEWDDLFGAAMLGAAKAVSEWDEGQGAKFSTFLMLCCRAAIIDELRKMIRWNKDIPFSHFESSWDNGRNSFKAGGAGASRGEDETSYEDTITKTVWDEDEYLNPEEELLHKEDIEFSRRKVAALQSKLNERELFVLWHTILTDSPMTYRDMGEQFGCSKDAIMRDYQRICKMLKED